MSDGTVLLADHYLPVSVAAAATVLVRCPYGRGGPFALHSAQLLAERGYHVLLQSVPPGWPSWSCWCGSDSG
jgi:uncharacterized protein